MTCIIDFVQCIALTKDMTLQLQFCLFPLKLSFSRLYDFDLNVQAINIYDFNT